MHELAHQWFGDDLRLGLWQDIWLNEGFATYAEWLWSEREGLGTAQEIFDFYMSVIPADDPFWTVVIGDPGPELLFDIAVYYRGAMTLHALRLEIGDEDFFRILRTWADQQAGDTVSTPEFIAPGRTDLRPGARRPLRDVAVHAGQAGRRRGRSCRPLDRCDGHHGQAAAHPPTLTELAHPGRLTAKRRRYVSNLADRSTKLLT